MFLLFTGSQWLIKTLLVLSLALLAYGIIRPVKSASHLAIRRLGMLFFIGVAAVTAVFPQIVTYVAQYLGIGRGADLLLYGLTIAFFSSLATAYRKDSATERKLTKLARTIALSDVQHKTED
ncbi:hypothetical protein HMPREF0044_0799 [Gleimia coleocanis DSM 15436]|uniref:DUF2304 domain-containing protein n=1 Tax=Gleimia coleocanis DSM 15436 TaxID=525245 RepID=C0VZS1_9ACTO|nr:DUF2304 domain-containing protein [Gleimia coleocanis]EEH63780.1 hypothetical protein HMPREF0044_0799 [Gleimia coleocanis DSM 15436]